MNLFKTTLLTLTTLVCSPLVLASQPADHLLNPQPKLFLSVVDKATQKPVTHSLTEAQTLSRSNTQHHLCWVVFDMPLPANAQIVEQIQSPDAAVFVDATAQLTSTRDLKQHHIVSNVQTNGEFVEKCWQFEPRDPLGTYQITIQVEDILFPSQTFRLVK